MNQIDLDAFDAMVRNVTSGIIPEKLPVIEPFAFNGIMLTPRIAGIILALSAELREYRNEASKRVRPKNAKAHETGAE